jgi:gliding motility-associated-like protein
LPSKSFVDAPHLNPLFHYLYPPFKTHRNKSRLMQPVTMVFPFFPFKRRKGLILKAGAFFLLFPSFLHAQLVFQKTFGGPQNEYFNQIRTLPSGGYALAGAAASGSAGERDYYIQTTDQAGNAVWSRQEGTSARDIAWDISLLQNGDYLVTGATLNSPPTLDNGFFGRYDATGNPIWTRGFGANATDDEFFKGQAIQPAGFAFCGFSDGFGGQVNMSLAITDPLGNILSVNHFGEAGLEYAYDFKQTNDGGFILAGRTNSFGLGNDAYLVKISALGLVQWARSVGGAGDDQAWSVQQTTDGGFLCGGFTSSFGNGEEMWAFKLDASGNLVWSRTIGLPLADRAYMARELPGNRVALVGFVTGGAGGKDAALVVLDANQNVAFAKAYGSAADEEFMAIDLRNNPSGGFAMAGYSSGLGAGLQDGYLVVTDTLGFSGCQETNLSVNATINNPNLAGSASVFVGFVPQVPNLIPSFPNFQPACLCQDYLPAQLPQGPTMVCASAAAQIYTQAPIEGNPIFQWGANSATLLPPTNDTIVSVSFGSQSAQLWVQANYGGCTQVNLDTLSINVSQLAVNITGTDSSCVGELIQLSAQVTSAVGNTSFTWNTGAISSSVTYSPTQTTGYGVTVTDGMGCTATDTTTVLVFPYPIVNLGPDTVACASIALSLTAGNPGAQYLWNTGATTGTILASNFGTYWVRVEKDGCASTDTLIVSFALPPGISILADSLVCPNALITLTAQTDTGASIVEYLWSNGQTTAQALVIPQTSDTITLEVTDSNGCQNTAIHFLNVIEVDPNRIWIPRAFSPNNDLINDSVWVHFSFPQLDLTEGFNFTIFDRWGGIIKDFDGPNDSWDGRTADGSERLPAGSYAWRLFIRNECFEEPVNRLGSLQLLR